MPSKTEVTLPRAAHVSVSRLLVSARFACLPVGSLPLEQKKGILHLAFRSFQAVYVCLAPQCSQ